MGILRRIFRPKRGEERRRLKKSAMKRFTVYNILQVLLK
jgi:hypothetical protein